jgi:hypothetical protein
MQFCETVKNMKMEEKKKSAKKYQNTKKNHFES